MPKLKPEELAQPEIPAEPDPEVQLSEEPARQPETLTEEEESAAFAQPEVAPAQPEPEVETAPEAPVFEEPAAPAEEVPVVEEPTIAMGKLDLSDPLSAPVDEALYDDQPTQVIPTQEIVEELEAKADAEVEGQGRQACEARKARENRKACQGGEGGKAQEEQEEGQRDSAPHHRVSGHYHCRCRDRVP